MKSTILFLAANPCGTDRLALDREAHAIQAELERSGRDCFDFQTRWAVEPLDLLRELRRLKPAVVHFSGHGYRGLASERSPGHAARRDVVHHWNGGFGHESSCGLFFQSADGWPQLVSAAAIMETFGAAGASVKLVVLSACYTELQAEALLAHVDCIIGMGGSIRDDAARSFAIGFYGGLGAREPVEAAYRQGRAAIHLEGMHDGDLPRLKVRAGVDSQRLVVAAAHTRDHPRPPPQSPARQIHARNYVEQVLGDQIVYLAPDTTEQEREAQLRRLERERQTTQDALYRADPLMKHRHPEDTGLKVVVVLIALIGTLSLTQGAFALAVLAVAGAGAYVLKRKSRHKT